MDLEIFQEVCYFDFDSSLAWRDSSNLLALLFNE